jgi:hypothetical protein
MTLRELAWSSPDFSSWYPTAARQALRGGVMMEFVRHVDDLAFFDESQNLVDYRAGNVTLQEVWRCKRDKATRILVRCSYCYVFVITLA